MLSTHKCLKFVLVKLWIPVSEVHKNTLVHLMEPPESGLYWVILLYNIKITYV